MRPLQRIANSDAHHRLFIAGCTAVIAYLGLRGRVSAATHIFVTWDVLSVCLLVLCWTSMIMTMPKNVRNIAKLQDSSRSAIFVFVVISACASLLALGVLLGSAKELSKSALTEHLMLSVATVACSWLLVHTVFALRYAHSFYEPGTEPGTISAGLEFPDETEPDYIDFAYFAFVIGMTFQVSDVQITSRAIRRLALIHGMVSFAFNTVILALSINIISGLL